MQRPAISPDGRTVAIDRRDTQNGLFDVWTADLMRATASRLTFNSNDSSDNGFPVWSPDSGHIAYYHRAPVDRPLCTKRQPAASGRTKSSTTHCPASGRGLVPRWPLHFRNSQDPKTKSTSGCCPCSVTGNPFRICTPISTNATAGCRLTANGWLTRRMRPSGMRSTCRLFQVPAASGRFPPTAVRCQYGAATERNCSSSAPTKK